MAISNSEDRGLNAGTGEDNILSIDNLAFSHDARELLLSIRRFRMRRGLHHFLSGPSGSGKSTLLGLIAGILKPSYGALRVLDGRMDRMSPGERDAFRGEHMGYIFQTFNLIPYLTVRENILLPCRMNPDRRRRAGNAQEAARELAAHMGIENILEQLASDISVGEAQRTAAARALIGSPELIIADEPTSALDENRKREFIRVLFAAAERRESTILFVSHDHRLAEHFPATVKLADLNHAKVRKLRGRKHALTGTDA